LSITTGEIAKLLQAELQGSSDVSILSIKPLSEAKPTDISFFSPTSKKRAGELLAQAKVTKAGALIVKEFFSDFSGVQIKVPDPLGAMVDLAPHFKVVVEKPGIHSTAVVDETASIHPSASIGPYVVIGARTEIGERTVIRSHTSIYEDVSIGTNCLIHAGAIIREGTKIGNNCVFQPGVVVGGDGFGYLPDQKVGLKRIPHIGHVTLEDDVDLGANTTIDRGTFGETRIGVGTKIDNLVQIGHNVLIGARALLCAQVGISGSCQIGNEVILGGQAGVADHLKIGDKVRVAAKCGVTGNVEKGDVAGYPHQEASAWRRNQVLIRYLPELMKNRGRKSKNIEN